MGELLRDSSERKELQKRMTVQQQLEASPRFNNQSPTITTKGDDFSSKHQI